MSNHDDDRPPKPPPATGSEAFGTDPDGRPSGSEAFGGGDADAPIRGSEAIGVSPDGSPLGAQAIGGEDAGEPLRGALLVGNDPQGNPTGAEAFGGSDAGSPLRGALLFGNDPAGDPTGSEAFGNADAQHAFRGSEAIGAPQGVPDRLHKDSIGYDFVGRLLTIDEGSMAGIRKDPRDRLRLRVLSILERTLACEGDRLRHGLNENSIPWGRLRRDRSLDRRLAESLRSHYRMAPGETLGIGQVRDLLERSNRMHSFALHCEWDHTPVRLSVNWGERTVAYGESALHKEHTFFIFRDPKGKELAYVDALVPRSATQRARVRTPERELLATVELAAPTVVEALGPGDPQTRFRAIVRDANEEPQLILQEERLTSRYFRADLFLPDEVTLVGQVEDRLQGGKIRTLIELDLPMHRVVAWGTAAVIADLARLRRGGWPEAPAEPGEAPIEGIEEALGPSRFSRQKKD